MKSGAIQVPSALLLDRNLAGSAKLIWISGQLGPGSTGRMDGKAGTEGVSARPHPPHSPALLQARSGLARHTILRGLSRLQTAGWLPPAPVGRGPTPCRASTPEGRATFPTDLLLDHMLGIQARLLYGTLQLTPGFDESQGQFTYTALRHLTGLSPNTLKRAVRALQNRGWLETTQQNKFSLVDFTLRNPVEDRRKAEVGAAGRRLNKAPFMGEALMREYLSLLADSEEFEDDASPGFLLNPFTGEEMQLDRYYPPGVAFEFNGPQHYGPTDRYADEAEFHRQRCRDHLKAGICSDRGIRLVVLHPQDLTLESIRQRVAGLLPLRNLDHRQPLITYLDSVSRAYRRRAQGLSPPRTSPPPA